MATTQDQIASAIVAIKDCSLIEIWEKEFHSKFLAETDPTEKIWSYESHQHMWRAALLYSLIALRKVADFAGDHRKRKDDVKLKDFGLDLESVTGESQIIDEATRTMIDKGIAHLTDRLDPDNEELEHLRGVLESKSTMLKALVDKLFALMDASN
ncbi:hypothetical protein [Mesorhizobium sp. 43Arga]